MGASFILCPRKKDRYGEKRYIREEELWQRVRESRTDNTFIYVVADAEYKKELSHIISDLGYHKNNRRPWSMVIFLTYLSNLG
ncbi:MAG: hypothetical protein PHD92_06010 [Eubacteriales bacterium]|nr:hypothetical protein [Eubacteriales bacterium]